MMRNFILKIACFLTGRNYRLLKESSEASKKHTLKFFGAMLIVMVSWGVISFLFAGRYLRLGTGGALTVAGVMVMVVALIERFILLTTTRNWWVLAPRFLLGVVMALLGAIIMDQVLFREDVDKKRDEVVQEEVDRIFKIKDREIRAQIAGLEQEIEQKSEQIAKTREAITKKPYIRIPATTIEWAVDTATGKRVEVGRRVDVRSVPNPKLEELKDLQRQDSVLRARKAMLEDRLLLLRKEIEHDIKSKRGLLDEISVLLFHIILKSPVAAFVYALVFGFFLMIELLVLIGKVFDEPDDYDHRVNYQKEMYIRQLHAARTT